jgi:hypothetical protein
MTHQTSDQDTSYHGITKPAFEKDPWDHDYYDLIDKIDNELILKDTISNRPSSPPNNSWFLATDEDILYYYDGSWRVIAGSDIQDSSDIDHDSTVGGTDSDAHHTKTTSSADLTDVSADSVSDAHHNKTVTLDELSDTDIIDVDVDNESNRPVSGSSGHLFIANDTGRIYYDNGASWDSVGVSDHSQLSGVSANDHHTKYTDEESQDATASLLVGGTNIDLTYNDVDNSLTVDTTALNEEEMEDAVASLIAAGTGINTVYDDAANTLTISTDDAAIEHNSLSGGTVSDAHHAKYTDADAQTAVEGSVNVEDLATSSTTSGEVPVSQGDGSLLMQSSGTDIDLIEVQSVDDLPNPDNTTVPTIAYVVGQDDYAGLFQA